MAAVTVQSNAATLIPGAVLDIQNLGSVDIYIDFDPNVTSSTGIKIAAGGNYSAPTGVALTGMYARAASSTADVRFTARVY